MSTIASPRPSTSIRSPSSTRASIDSSRLPAPTSTPNPAAPARRNRSALRDYYGLKAPAPKHADARISEESTRTELGPEAEEETLTELDKDGFDATTFVDDVLAREGLGGVLRVEADLLAQIRNLDSDRKSLVYDNYSKLLAATSTIRRMRTNMDPLAPTTHTLSPAIAHIAETAALLSSSIQKPRQAQGQDSHFQGLGIDVRIESDEDETARRKEKEKETVRWVLDCPRRLREMREKSDQEGAKKEWDSVRVLLEKWQGVRGVEQLRAECEEILEEIMDGSEEGNSSGSEAESAA